MIEHPRPALQGRRILVVEDEYLIADDMRRALSMAGAEVLGPAPTVDEAIALIETSDVDLAVLDVNLGGSPVWPVADMLTARGVPFVLTTGYDAVALPSAYLRTPRCEKPVDMRQVERALMAL